MSTVRYPCTGYISAEGFPEFLAKELGAPRKNIQAFARELGAAFDTPRVTLVNSGSSALLAAALACGQETGKGEALIAGYTAPTAIAALKLAGYSLRAVDTEVNGFCMDPLKLRAAIGKRTKVILYTHFLGFPAQTETIASIASQHGLKIIQDACETMNLLEDGCPTHAFADYTTYSFYHPHHLSSYGGGAVISNSNRQRELIESVTHWGRVCTCHFDPSICKAPAGMDHNFWYIRLGQNLEMSELNACFGRFQFATWPHQEQKRRENYGILYSRLAALSKRTGGKLFKVFPGLANVSPFVFPVTSYTRPALELAEALATRGVESRNLMGGVISRHPVFAKIPHDGLENCKRQSESSLFVGCHQTLPAEDVAAMAEILAEELAK